MAGIYIHIPFCRQKCHYCNFFSLASVKSRDAFVPRLLEEIEARKDYLNHEKVSTIYFGGGTPSLLPVDEIRRVLDAFFATFKIDPHAEITLEANPDDLHPDYLQQLKHSPVNRLSIGIQSFRDADLKYLNRVHSAREAKQALQMAQDAGFDNITIDLIYGIPTLGNEDWAYNLDVFFESGIRHLSAYALTVEPKTALHVLIAKGKMKAVDERQSAAQFEMLMQRMEQSGYVHYEISNFALPGHYSKHNSLYWLGGHYLGLGPSAHSFNGLERQWNVSNLSAYLHQQDISTRIAEKEVLSMEQRYNEYVMTSLRTVWGCDLLHIRNAFGETWADYAGKQSQKYLQNGKITLRDNRLFLTTSGKLYADGIAADLFADE